MKYVLNFITVVLIVALAYLLYQSIYEPIDFTSEKGKREAKVIKRLKDIRTSQELYREITDSFANNFDTLAYVLKNGKIPVIKIIGDEDEIGEDVKVTYDTIYFSAIDSIKSLKIDLDSLAIVPFSGSKKFDIDAGEISYQKTKVNVVQVGTQYKVFMGKYADKKFQKYVTGYDPDNTVKFGSMSTPNLTGNWE